MGAQMQAMKLVILAGGKGTRLGLNDRPKPMVPIGGKSLLERQIEIARKYGIKDVYVLSGHMSKVIQDHFGDGRDFGVNITHVVEDRPLGTAGAVKQLQGRINERFMVFYGDILLDFDVQRFMRFDLQAPSAATIIVHPNDHPFDSDLVEVNEAYEVTAFHSKDRDGKSFYRNLVNAAVYILGPEIFSSIPEDEATDFGRDIFPRLVTNGGKIRAYNTAEYIKDVGTLERLRSAGDDLSSGRVERFCRRHRRPAIFMDRDGTLIKDVDLLHRAGDVELYPYSGPSIKKINESDYLCILATNQPVVARNLCSITDLWRIHNRLETLLAEDGAYLDNIYFCPHHPDRGYPGENPEFKMECGCRKPKTGMIERAAAEFNIDLGSSWMIGDTSTDVLTGINCGMRTILLRTGAAGRDGKFECDPDFVFDDLGRAVEFILTGEAASRMDETKPDQRRSQTKARRHEEKQIR